uniref:Endonuclease/exonuclease/phosphatase domain-containing protein n=1 Tax=Poecilia formosa TaxID=48698 RepID=A0A087XR38_POEFO
RRWNLRVTGLPEKDDENLRESIIGILTRIIPVSVERLRDTVDTVHRLGKKAGSLSDNNRPRAVIIQFGMRTMRDEVWKKSKDAKQETHSSSEESKFWKLQWGDEMYFSHGTSHSAGVMILSYKFSGSVLDHVSDTNGHWVTTIVEINGNKIILVCLYGYNNKAMNQLGVMIKHWKLKYSTDQVILGGDFNVAPDGSIDRLPSGGQHHIFNDIFVNLISNTNLTDCWRIRNPTTRQYSCFNPSGNGQCSRLDYWLIPHNMVNNISNCEISAAPLTDHCSVTLFLSVNISKPLSILAWKFNSNLLNNKTFCSEILNLIKDISVMNMSPLNKWEWFKFNVRLAAIKTGKLVSKLMKQKQSQLIGNINSLCSKSVLSSEELSELDVVKSQLDDLFLDKARGAFIRSRARWIEDGEKNSSYFFNLEKQRQSKKMIGKLFINGSITEDPDLINLTIKNFYSNLYCSKYSESNCQSFFDEFQECVEKIDSDFKNLMDDDLNIEELDVAMQQMAKGKSPGLDGLTIEFYKDLRKLLFEALLECISNNNLSPTMKRGLITLIPKANKDPLLLDNWRPITLLFTDYKILALVFANRLNSGLGSFIN